MFITIKRWTLVYLLMVIGVLVLFSAILFQGNVVQTAHTTRIEEEVSPILIVDAGHGGEDGGAVAVDGSVESALNLSIALAVAEGASLLGQDVLLTRREDVSLHDQSAVTLREKKVSDLKNRVALCNGTENAILLSIHQNTLPDAPQVRGAQVFYNQVDGSEELAVALQTALNAALNGENAKSAKRIADSIYLMREADCPAVIVECGFLSNAEDVRQLTDASYQKKLAAVILSAVMQYLNGES